MMMDTQGCTWIWGGSTVILLILSLALKGLGLFSSWVIVLAVAAIPTALVALIFLYLVLSWISEGSH